MVSGVISFLAASIPTWIQHPPSTVNSQTYDTQNSKSQTFQSHEANLPFAAFLKEPLKGEGVWLQGWFTIPSLNLTQKASFSKDTSIVSRNSCSSRVIYHPSLPLLPAVSNSHNGFLIFVVVNLRLGAYTNTHTPETKTNKRPWLCFKLIGLAVLDPDLRVPTSLVLSVF